MNNSNKNAIAILIFMFLLIWSVAKQGENQQPKLQIELRIEYGS
ncbi:hypothetical protein [Plectonema radiosum]|nr:hypothetical protein [Plectonema radiosum]